MLSAIKDKMDDWKTKTLEKRAIQLHGDNAKLEKKIAKMQAGRPIELIKTKRRDPVKNTGDGHLKKQIYAQTADELNKRENSQSKTKSRESPQTTKSGSEEKESCLKQAIKKRPMKRSRKRCHFCRKRGHVQKDCVKRQLLREWIWGDASET